MNSHIKVVWVLGLIISLGGCSSDYENSNAEIERGKVADGGTAVILQFTGGACDRDSEALVTETAEAVKVALRIRSKKGPCTAEAIHYAATVKLRSAVGNKTLRDGGGHSIDLTPASKPINPRPFPVTKVTYKK